MIRQTLKKLVRTNKFFGALYDIYLNIKLKKIIRTKNKKFSKSGIETFQDLCKLLNERNIKFWLCYGTLLGYVRENGILKHDFDFDIGTPINVECRDGAILITRADMIWGKAKEL